MQTDLSNMMFPICHTKRKREIITFCDEKDVVFPALSKLLLGKQIHEILLVISALYLEIRYWIPSLFPTH